MKRPIVIVGVLLTVACALLYIYEPGLLSAVSRAAYDNLLRLHHQPPQSDRVAVVDLDDESLAKHGQWPWPRYLVADLVDRILRAGAAVVALDIVFPEPDRTSPLHMQRAMTEQFGLQLGLRDIPEDLRDFDRILARSLASGKTVLGMYLHGVEEPVQTVDENLDPSYQSRFFARGPGDLTKHLYQADGMTLSIPCLSAAAANNAFFNVLPDPDNVVRSVPLVWANGPRRIYPSVALEAVRLLLGVPQIGIEFDRDGISYLQVGHRVVPTDASGRLVINYRSLRRNAAGLDETFPVFSAKNVLAGRTENDVLKGKIVFVGTSAAGLRDLRATPLTPQFSGVEIQATVVDSLLAGDFLLMPSWMTAANLVIILAAGLFITLAVDRQRSWLAFLTTAATAAACASASLFLLQVYRVVFVPTWPLFTMLVVYPVLTMISYWERERRERWIRKAFGAMVSNKVLSYLEEHPAEAALTGTGREATVMFSDIRGFSTIAESLQPDQLSILLNRYLSPMTSIIMMRDGYVDKYIGDMIMAEWGVPYAIPDHAAQACHAALEQVEQLARMRPRLQTLFGHEIHVRIGINTGLMIAGNMGSEHRCQYTVMGDTVNLASRLEPLNKQYGTTIIIGRSTYLQVRDVFETRMLDRVTVAGKTEEVLVYELLARRGELPDRKREIARLYEEALKLYWEGKWDEPVNCLKQALRLDRGDEPSARLLEKISGMHIDADVLENVLSGV